MCTNRFMFSGIAVLTIVSATLGDDYQIDRYTVDAGGGYSAGGSIEMEGTIGQPDAGTLSGGTFMLTGGFWAGQASPDGEPIAIVSVNSCLLHDDGGPSEIELCIDLLAQTNPVEPRVGGPDTLVFGFSGDVDGPP